MITNEELDDLIQEVEAGLVTLSKSEESSQEASAEESNDLIKDEAEEEILAEEAAPALEAEAAPQAEEESAELAPEMAEEAVAEEAAPEAAMDEQISPEDLSEIYGQMDEEELAMHYEAIRLAMEALWSQEAPAQEAAPEMAEQAPQEELAMSEMQDAEEEEAQGGEIKAGSLAKEECKPEEQEQADDDMKKMEEELEDLKKSNAGLESALERFVEIAMKRFPQRKSVTEIGLEKSEDSITGEALKKSALEITKLPTLSKSEREVLNDYFVTGKNEVAVKELVKAKKA